MTMATENDIKGYVAALKGALYADDEKVGMEAIASLLEIVLVDFHRVADALEHLALNK